MSKVHRITRVTVNVLAYNEQQFIDSSLEAISKALAKLTDIQVKVNVICNGCMDDTFVKAQAFCSQYLSWQAFDIKLADKANAWNFAIAQSEDECAFSVFVDGDCAISADAIKSLLDTYAINLESYIIAGVPVAKGRCYQEILDNTLKGEALNGNLYALTPRFLAKIKAKKFLLPVGLIGDDSLLAWVASHDFRLSHGFSYGKLVGCRHAEFDYHRLAPSSVVNILLYVKRLTRYSLRHLQQNAIREHLNEHDDFATLPTDISCLYSKVKCSHLRGGLINKAFDLANLIKIKKLIKNSELLHEKC